MSAWYSTARHSFSLQFRVCRRSSTLVPDLKTHETLDKSCEIHKSQITTVTSAVNVRLTHARIHSCPLLADTKQYPAFVGHKPGRNNTQRHKLDIQLIMIMNRTLYIAARWVITAFLLPFLNMCFPPLPGDPQMSPPFQTYCKFLLLFCVRNKSAGHGRLGLIKLSKCGSTGIIEAFISPSHITAAD